MWLEHNASPAQAALGASGPQTEKLGSHRPPDGFVVSHFALVAPLRLVGGPQRGSFSILNLFLLHSPSPLLPLFFSIFTLPHFHSFLSPAVSFFLSFFFFELRISLCAWQAQTEKKKISTVLSYSFGSQYVSFTLILFYIAHSFFVFMYLFCSTACQKNVQNFFLTCLAASKDQKVRTFYQAEPCWMRWHLCYLFSQQL